MKFYCVNLRFSVIYFLERTVINVLYSLSKSENEIYHNKILQHKYFTFFKYLTQIYGFAKNLLFKTLANEFVSMRVLFTSSHSGEIFLAK